MKKNKIEVLIKLIFMGTLMGILVFGMFELLTYKKVEVKQDNDTGTLNSDLNKDFNLGLNDSNIFTGYSALFNLKPDKWKRGFFFDKQFWCLLDENKTIIVTEGKCEGDEN